MDPNAALAAIRQAIDQLEHETLDRDDEIPALYAVVEHFRALDEWLQRGGFLPEAWEYTDRGPRSTTSEAEQTLARIWDVLKPEPLGPPNPAHGHLPDHHDA